ncbi:MAG: hypothetical protein J6K75_02265 [Erysipelotrichaceae bacterium]|nr:hypothetical protein [Erysipelotrichaceae bacterium]
MMRRMKSCLVCLILLMSFVLPVYADMGPKPSVHVDVECDEETYYMTLLTERRQYGPYREYESTASNDSEENPIKGKFKEYAFQDEFYLVGDIEQLSHDDTYSWTYMAPETFKILVYFPSTDSFLCSEAMSRYAYQSTYQLVIDVESGIFDLSQNYDYSGLLVSFLFCFSMTLLIEIMIGLSFNFRAKNELQIIVMVNTVTQILLHAFIHFMLYQRDNFTAAFCYLMAEVVVFVLESFIYCQTLPKKKHPVLYALVSNFISFVTGVFLVFLSGMTV